MDCNELPEKVEITYQGQPVKVEVHCTLEKTLFMVHFEGKDKPAVTITMEADQHGNESWLENGVPTDRADEIGRILESAFL